MLTVLTPYILALKYCRSVLCQGLTPLTIRHPKKGMMMLEEANNRVESFWQEVAEYLKAPASFENTHWYKFQLAAKAHLMMVVDMLKSY